MRFVLVVAVALFAVPLVARATCDSNAGGMAGECSVTATCTLSGVAAEGSPCEQCDVTPSTPDACIEKFSSTDYQPYCSTATSTSTSWSEIWCEPPGDNSGRVNNCASATPTAFALAGLAAFAMRRRRATR